ncbi:MAG: chromate resistance protein [Dehalococcoidia bacterium]|nr:chromate resistance protein [Dehalococcoidia bacterium]
MPVIVSHYSPDLDSITATWIVRRFGGMADAQFAFVPAGSTLGGAPVDSDPEVIHVDTGFGRFDHHQPEAADPAVCAARLAAEAYAPADRALQRLVAWVVEVDNGREPPEQALHPFGVTALIHGLNRLSGDPSWVMETMLPLLDAWYRAAQDHVAAEEEIEQATWFETPWGPGVALSERRASAQQLAYARGAVLYLARTPEGWHRFTAPAWSTVDLSETAALLRAREPDVDWYLHPSHKLLLNGSRKAPPRALSRLTLDDLIAIVRLPAEAKT